MPLWVLHARQRCNLLSFLRFYLHSRWLLVCVWLNWRSVGCKWRLLQKTVCCCFSMWWWNSMFKKHKLMATDNKYLRVFVLLTWSQLWPLQWSIFLSTNYVSLYGSCWLCWWEQVLQENIVESGYSLICFHNLYMPKLEGPFESLVVLK